MCGLAGLIGESTKPEQSFALISKLLEKLEVRGKDASGFWGTQRGDGKTFYHKEPVTSSRFVQGSDWRGIAELNPNLLLTHARGASEGVGVPTINRNNHPFVNSDLSVALIHNGRIPDVIYEELRKKYEVLSSCDSEILLRIFEGADESADIEIELAEEEKDIAARLVGLRDIWSTVSRGHIAAGIGERLSEGRRRLWLFRNHHRPLWIFDLREVLGQVFFASTPQIWHMAVDECRPLKQLLRKTKLKFMELPTEEIWLMEIGQDSPIITDNQLHKFEVEATGDFELWEYSGEPIKAKAPVFDGIHTSLNSEEEINRPFNFKETDYFQTNATPMRKIYDLCANIQETTTEIETLVQHSFQPMSQEYLLADLECAMGKLRTVLRMLGG